MSKPITKAVDAIDHVATGKYIRKCREKKSLSLRAVGLATELSPIYLSDLERGRRNWTFELYSRVIDAINATPKGR